MKGKLTATVIDLVAIYTESPSSCPTSSTTIVIIWFIYLISSQHAIKTEIVDNYYKMPVARGQRKVEPSHRPL